MSQTPSTTALYTASEVEARTGVPASTLRQWERRYGFPSPSRTAGGYRMYSPFDLACIGFIQARQAEGVVVSRAVSLAREHFVPPPSFDLPVIEELLRALLRHDHREATRLLRQAQDIFSTEEVMLNVMQPVMTRLGELWQRSEITIAHEHQASALFRTRLTQFLEAAGDNKVGPVAVLSCGPGEHHELGLLTLAVLLARRGFNVHYLGSDVPVPDVARYCREVGAWALLLSVNSPAALERLRGELGRGIDLGAPLYLGGQAINTPGLARDLGGAWLGDSALEAADALAQLALRSREGSRPRAHWAPAAHAHLTHTQTDGDETDLELLFGDDR